MPVVLFSELWPLDLISWMLTPRGAEVAGKAPCSFNSNDTGSSAVVRTAMKMKLRVRSLIIDCSVGAYYMEYGTQLKPLAGNVEFDD